MSPSHWQLFLDDHALARSTGFDRVVHHPRALGVVIPADRPWETVGAAPIYVERRADGSFFAHYHAMWWDLDLGSKLEGFQKDRAHHMFLRTAIATSEDGIHWQKPSLGLAEGPAAVDATRHAPYPSPSGVSRDNNLGMPFLVVADLARHGNVTDPEKRYALRLAPDHSGPSGVGANWRNAPRGYFAREMPDFLHDTQWKDRLLDSGGNFDPRRHVLHFWDDLHGEWVAMSQGVIPHWLPSREVARFASKDLVHWTSQGVLYPDSADSHVQDRYDEPMGLTAFHAEGVAFGLLSWFHSDRSHPDAGPHLQATPEHPQVWPWCRKGTNEMRITVSRDGGVTWDRASSREAWIPHGSEEDSIDRLVIGCLPPVHVGDEDWFYTNVINGDHLGIRNDREQTLYYHDRIPVHQTALYVQKHNRYVSLRARSQTEVLITAPVRIQDSDLQINVDANRGVVRAAIALADPIPTHGGSTPSTAPHLYLENPIPGFTFHDCVPVRANSTEFTVQFGSGASLDGLRGRSVRLLFEMNDADLYGFRV
ncbi:MAG: hypothetical protein HYU36_21950 [Planctomycetes bacterium]|nr:hypothetical protein [Planctomycetota bacterium]